MNYITKTYNPADMEDVQSRLKDIVEVWLKSDQSKPLENWIIIALFKQGYKIIKTGKQ